MATFSNKQIRAIAALMLATLTATGPVAAQAWHPRGDEHQDNEGRSEGRSDGHARGRMQPEQRRADQQDRPEPRPNDTWRSHPGSNWAEPGTSAGDREVRRDRDRDGDRDGYRQSDRQTARRNDGRDYRHSDRHWNNAWRVHPRYDWSGYRRGHPQIYRLGAYTAPYRGYSYHRLSIGFVLNSLFFADRYWIADPWAYRLPDAYGSYRWVRYYDDALLVDIYSGEVIDALYDFFW